MLLTLGVLALPATAGADTIKVKNEKNSGAGSLRQALLDALDGDTVKVPAGHYVVKQERLVLNADVEVVGAGSKKTVLDGDNKTGVLFLEAGAEGTLSKLAITRGRDVFGGGIRSAGSLQLDQVLMEKNKAKSSDNRSHGGAIYSDGGTVEIIRSEISRNKSLAKVDLAMAGAIEMSGGDGSTLSIDRSEVSSNTAKGLGGYGGAITYQTFHTGGFDDLNISQSTLANNKALGSGDSVIGGALYYEPIVTAAGGTSSLTIENTTVTGNRATSEEALGFGGGLFLSTLVSGGASASMNLTNSTIAENEVEASAQPSLGGGVGIGSGGVPVVTNTIIANNTADDPNAANCSTALNSADGNLENVNTCAFGGVNDVIANPKLKDLANNGGPTPTMALPKSSPAVDEGVSGSCAPTDQRGVNRPQGPVCDIGAFELEQ